jgi:signal transduction histidine kinase
MANRRNTYFIFQALLTVILLLFFLYRKEFILTQPVLLSVVCSLLGGILVFLAVAPTRWLEKQWVQGLWFLSDVLISSFTLYWARQPGSDLYLTYFLVIFGTALTENISHSFLVALVATLLYGYLSLRTTPGGVPTDPEFWLRLPYLWIFASFTALLTRDSRESRKQQEQSYKERLFHMERLAALGQISAEVAHRIKAPLTTIRVNAEVLAHQAQLPPAMQKDLLQIQHEVDHCKEILQKLLELGRIEEMDQDPLDLQQAILAAVETIRPQLAPHKILLKTEGLDQGAPILGDSILVSESIVAVLQNAIEAMPHGGDLSVQLNLRKKLPWWWFRSSQKDFFEVLIQDSGEGIPKERLETIFRPFYTTKEGKGSGLGLSAALRIVDKHGGSIRVASDGTGQGAVFTLTFPRTTLRSASRSKNTQPLKK